MIAVTFLIPTLDRSGAEKQLTLLACGLPRHLFRVEVIALTRGGPYESVLRDAGIPVTVLHKRSKFEPRIVFELRRRLKAQPPEVLHTWMFTANAYGRLALPRRRSFQVVVSERCVDSWKSRWQLWLDRRLEQRTDCFLANSHSVADFCRSQGAPEARIGVIPNAVIAPPAPAMSKKELLQQLGFPDDARLVGYIGRLASQKQVQTLLWGMQVLRQADDRARMLIVGDGPERASLQQFAHDVECADFVRFLGHRDDASTLLHHLDAFWLASRFEGMSNSLMEAMACGVPVIASQIPPNRELITHGEHGYLANLGDGVAYAQFTAKIWREPELRSRLVAAAKQRMLDEFGLERMIARHAELYESLCLPGTASRVDDDTKGGNAERHP